MDRILEPIFQPVKVLIGTVYDVLFDAAQKVWKLAKPVAMIGLLVDLLTGKLGWIQTMLGYYRTFMHDTSGSSWIVLVLAAVLVLTYMSGGKKG
jgi:hypothetical protein